MKSNNAYYNHGRVHCINVGVCSRKILVGVFCQRQWKSIYFSHECHLNYSHQMSDFSLKMHQIQFSAGAAPHTPLGSSQRSTDLLTGFEEKGSEMKGNREGKGEKREGK